jgi:phosphoribosylformimino-5-aminoimidazole carboxamide ribotide isomerase
MRIIPAIDILDGKCVRLTKGDYATSKIYHENPLDVALQFEAAGLQYLHIVDLDGAKSKHIVNHHVLREIASKTSLKIDFGGGIKTEEDLQIAFDCGASQVTAGSIAVQSRETVFNWGAKYGTGKIIIGADVNNEYIAINGWQEQSSLFLYDLLEDYMHYGFQYVICTDISKDGMLQGPSVALYKKVLERFPEIKLIASGGVSSIDDLQVLADLGLDGAIIGKAIYEGKVELHDLVKLQNHAG